jgi:hypothetical protein
MESVDIFRGVDTIKQVILRKPLGEWKLKQNSIHALVSIEIIYGT